MVQKLEEFIEKREDWTLRQYPRVNSVKKMVIDPAAKKYIRLHFSEQNSVNGFWSNMKKTPWFGWTKQVYFATFEHSLHF